MIDQEVADAGGADVYDRDSMVVGGEPEPRVTMTPSAKASLKPGDILGAYQLLLPIGEGGMGRVWVAREQQSGPFPRYVAIKTALAESSSNRSFWTVLLDEAHIASRIRHPNVCAIHAVETERNIVYLVMDWSDAGSLREVLDAAPGSKIPVQIAARIVASVCAGLHAAHELEDDDGTPLGVVHRDVSPQNILFSTSGQTKVTDFGVAKARGQLHEPTRTGELKGKLSYMAPEQVTLKDVDRRADVFALGCVLFEATVGKRPFHGNDALATLYSLLEQPLVPPREVDPDYPEGLEAIVLKALQRDPVDRYQTAEELGYALEAWMTSSRTIVTESQVAGVIRETLGARIKQRAAALQEMVRRLDAGERIVDEDSLGENGGARDVSTASVVMSAEAGAARVRRAVLAGVAGALVVAAGAAVLLRGPRASEGPPLVQATVTSAPVVSGVASVAAAPSANPAEISISFASQPAEAKLAVDDGATREGPFTLHVPVDGKAHTLRASARGYHEKLVPLVFDHDQTVTITLDPVSGSSRGGRHAAAAAPQPQAAADAPPGPHRGPGDLPTVVQKPTRTLDSDNPFAK